jgi:putative flippase GtrA
MIKSLLENKQLLRFCVVGCTATLVHWCVFVIIVPFGITPLIANVFAFLLSFQVSYQGHKRWTFQQKKLEHSKTLPKFFAVAYLSFAINESLLALLLAFTNLDYRLAMIIVLLAVAMITFMLSKYWAFKT